MPSALPISFAPRSPLLLLGALIASLGLVLGCNSGEGAPSDADVPYQVGEPIEDSTYALIVTSEYGTDTLRARAYQRRMQSVMQRIPSGQRADSQMQQLHRRFIQQFVSQHVLSGEAEARNIEADTARVGQQMRQMRNRFPSDSVFQQQLARTNMTMDSLRQMMADRVRQQMLQEELASGAEQPTSSEIESYRRDQQQTEIRARHILFRVGEDASQDTVDSVRARAQQILDSLQSDGADFATLAERYSEGPSADQGGDLGYFTRDRMVEPFANAAFALQDSGAVVQEPVRTRFGFHVIQLTGRRQTELMDTTQARQQMMNERRQQALEEERDQLLQKATVRINPGIVQAGIVG